MQFKQTLRVKLETNLNENDYTILDSTGNTTTSCWEVECPIGHSFDVRVDLLKQNFYSGRVVSCPVCKFSAKVLSLEQSSNVRFIDAPDYKIVRCLDCNLTYHYRGNFYQQFRCCCRRASRKVEKILYEGLHRYFPEQMTKELVYLDNGHKCDIALLVEDKCYYIELDERTHFYEPCLSIDKENTKLFLENRSANEYLIRVHDKIVKNQLDELCLTIFEEIVGKHDIPVFTTIIDDQDGYHHLECQDDFRATIHFSSSELKNQG